MTAIELAVEDVSKAIATVTSRIEDARTYYGGSGALSELSGMYCLRLAEFVDLMARAPALCDAEVSTQAHKILYRAQRNGVEPAKAIELEHVIVPIQDALQAVDLAYSKLRRLQ